jgi:hypothetical protein
MVKNKNNSNNSKNSDQGGKKIINRTNRSTAARLIQTALISPLSDINSINLIFDCLWLVAHFPIDIYLEPNFSSATIHSLNGTKFTNIQKVFMSSAREWFRLLLTIAHCNESMVEQSYLSIAEKSAYFFSLVVVDGMVGGWQVFLCLP